MDVNQVASLYIDMLRRLIRKKKFQTLLHKRWYLVAVDGTQKYVMDEYWDERYLRRKIRGKDSEYQYYAYVLEAVLLCSNGILCAADEYIFGKQWGIGGNRKRRKMETGLRIESVPPAGEAAETGVSETAAHPADGRTLCERAGYGSLP